MSLSSPPSRLANNSTTLHGQLMQTCTMHVLGFVTLLSLVHVCIGQLPACYYYGGSPATFDVPCDPDASNSTCCGPGYSCDTNLFCMGSAPAIGSCTDPTWQSVDCPLAVGGPSHFPCVPNLSLVSSSVLFTKQTPRRYELF